MSQVIVTNGTATILQGTCFASVPHHLSYAPAIGNIILTPQDDVGGRNYWPSSSTTATFQINMSMMDPDVDHVFSWCILGAAVATSAPPNPPGAFPITVADVQAHLNANFDSESNAYSVYGLNIADTCLQAHVTFANNYVSSILSSPVSPSDPAYPVAYNVALDIACIRILVVSMGGSLVGAFDYFLGDLRVARAGPYKEAITATLQGFREDLSRQLVNLSTPVLTAEASMKDDLPTYQGGLMNP